MQIAEPSGEAGYDKDAVDRRPERLSSQQANPSCCELASCGEEAVKLLCSVIQELIYGEDSMR